MPIYSFKCPSCAELEAVEVIISLSAFEQLKSGEIEAPKCESCKTALEQQIAATPGKVLGGTPKFHFTRGSR